MAVIWWFCRTAGLDKPARATVCIIALAVFLLTVPPRAPTLRAAIICLVFFISLFFRRAPNPLNTLSLAALIILLIRPTQLFDAGWQLSFTCVLGILLFAEPIYYFFYENTTGRFGLSQTSRHRLFLRMITIPARLFSVGLAAWLGGAGILLYHFYTVTPLTCIWTIIAFPFIALILTGGFLKIFFSLLLPSLSALLAAALTALSSVLICIVRFIADMNISQLLIGKVPFALIVFYYAVIIFTALAHFRRPVIKKAISTIMVLVIAFSLCGLKWQKTHRSSLVLNCLDAGHGQAILAQMPGKANVLFDAGSLYKSDIGRRTVVPFLDYMGISRLEAIIISHNDVDHINGILEIAAEKKVGAIYANNVFFSGPDRWSTAEFLRSCLMKKGLKMQRLGNVPDMAAPAVIRIIWPNNGVSTDVRLNDNDKSTVALIEFAGRKILLCSDIEKGAQKSLLTLFPDLRADVVVMPHHGSYRSLEESFIQQLGSKILITSCSRKQYEKQKKIAETDNMKLLYTPRDGAIAVSIDKDGLIACTTQIRDQR
jgi:competence protein ComEC